MIIILAFYNADCNADCWLVDHQHPDYTTRLYQVHKADLQGGKESCLIATHSTGLWTVIYQHCLWLEWLRGEFDFKASPPAWGQTFTFTLSLSSLLFPHFTDTCAPPLSIASLLLFNPLVFPFGEVARSQICNTFKLDMDLNMWWQAAPLLHL